MGQSIHLFIPQVGLLRSSSRISREQKAAHANTMPLRTIMSHSRAFTIYLPTWTWRNRDKESPERTFAQAYLPNELSVLQPFKINFILAMLTFKKVVRSTTSLFLPSFNNRHQHGFICVLFKKIPNVIKFSLSVLLPNGPALPRLRRDVRCQQMILEWSSTPGPPAYSALWIHIISKLRDSYFVTILHSVFVLTANNFLNVNI